MARHCEFLDCRCDDERCDGNECLELEFFQRIAEATSEIHRELEQTRSRLHLCEASRRGAMKDVQHLGRIVTGFRTLILTCPEGDKAAWRQMKEALDAWTEDRDPPGEHLALVPRAKWQEIVSRVESAHLALDHFANNRGEVALTDARLDVYRAMALVRAQTKEDPDE